VSSSFDPQRGLIVIGAEIGGPSGSAILRLAVDTGATSTVVNVAMLVAIGRIPRWLRTGPRSPREVASSLHPASTCRD
jgi:hypothetical protein